MSQLIRVLISPVNHRFRSELFYFLLDLLLSFILFIFSGVRLVDSFSAAKMRILCLIMVGAFLLSIAIAENSDSQRVNGKPHASTAAYRSPSQLRNVPWSLRRVSENSPVFTPSNNMIISDNIASPAISVSQYIHREQKTTMPVEDSMILEPMHKHSSRSSWMDWMPDFFDDDPPPEPGPLIGPIDFPGLSRNLYIRQNEPLDDDTNHVVIHVINRKTPSYFPASSALVTHENNQNPSQHAGSFYTNPIKSPEIEFQTAPFPYKLVEGHPWKLQTHTSDDKEIKEKNSQYSLIGIPTEVTNDKFHFRQFSTTAKPANQRLDSQTFIIEDRGQHYGRNIESQSPVMFPTPNRTSTAIKQEQKYAWQRKYGYQNNTKVPSDNVRMATDNLHAKLTQIPIANRRQVNRINNAPSRVSRTSDTSSRLPINQFSHSDMVNETQRSSVYIREPALPEVKNLDLNFVTREVSPRQPRNYLPHFNKVNETPRSPVYIHKPSILKIKEALEVINASIVNNTTDGLTGKTSDNVMHNIMTMTASQQWKNITANLVESEKSLIKSVEAERRIDIMTDDEKQTKESTITTTTTTTTTTVAPSASTTCKTGKIKANMEEAVEKMMSSFSQWRYKVVSTNFLKELDSKEENRSNQDR
ncbi:uncharacterized protein LOC131664908 isoform X2 [Phymastichus coffea]|uniref:uncharacterized protein LOC131664908 isoform X2 n=1 Tax=Phymastichus coffea TaxID=108790 RepID=UPI00273ABC0A|nr:uncharacterized protein LOC131664908 isoform X2 [Phymastichus coffea]